MKIAIGCDDAAYNLKTELIEYLEEKKIEFKDFGIKAGEVVLYPDIAVVVAEAVARGEFERGILVCGTGLGMAISANKVPGIRAAVCHDPFTTERSRKSNNAQIMCMGSRIIAPHLAKYLLDLWLKCDFSGGGSEPKVARIMKYEEMYLKGEREI